MSGFRAHPPPVKVDATEGLCATGRYDAELWFSDDPTAETEAIRICRRCPIQSACLEGALERNERHGVWGGKRLGRRDTRQADMRTWAAEVGVLIPRTGRIPAWIEEAYEDARAQLAAATDEALAHDVANRHRKTA